MGYRRQVFIVADKSPLHQQPLERTLRAKISLSPQRPLKTSLIAQGWFHKCLVAQERFTSGAEARIFRGLIGAAEAVPSHESLREGTAALAFVSVQFALVPCGAGIESQALAAWLKPCPDTKRAFFSGL
jgi:hypothetical protein